MNIIEKIISKDKWDIKCPYTMSPIGLCIHNTANNASAINEISYMSNNNNEVSFHFAVDNKEVIQAIPLNRNSWHAGDGGNGEGNRKYISIEICYSTSNDINLYNKSEEKAIELIVYLLKKYNWTVKNIKKHQDFSGKYCPHRILDNGWDSFIRKIESALNQTQTPNKTPSKSDDLFRVRKEWNNPKSQLGAFKNLNYAINLAKINNGYKVYNNKGVCVWQPIITKPSNVEIPTTKEYTEFGVGLPLQTVNVYTEPNKSSKSGLTYVRGEHFYYNHVIIKGNQVWVRYLNYNKKYSYILVMENGIRYVKCI